MAPTPDSQALAANEILIAPSSEYRRPTDMGAKYLPTKKDAKLNQRFANKQLLPKSQFKKPDAKQPASTPKTKGK